MAAAHSPILGYNDGYEDYKGETRDDLAHGHGTLRYRTGSRYEGVVYEGQWARGRKDGHGVLHMTNGMTYEGQWKTDWREGYGRVFLSDGTIEYEGMWQGGHRHGYGREFVGEAFEYAGQWKEGWREGYGKEWFADGAVYEGDMKLGMRDGVGMLRYANGAVYHGHWTRDKRNGDGKLELTNGDVYDGQWKMGTREGIGTMRCGNGVVYEGAWVDGQKEGHGTETTKSMTRHGRERVRVQSGIFHKGVFAAHATRRDAVRKRQADARAARTQRAREEVESTHDGFASQGVEVGCVPQCAICQEGLHHGDASYAFVPCGHRVLCGTCGPKILVERCIVCRQRATRILRIF